MNRRGWQLRTKITFAVAAAVLASAATVSFAAYSFEASSQHQQFSESATSQTLIDKTYLLSVIKTESAAQLTATIDAYFKDRYAAAVYEAGTAPQCTDQISSPCLADLSIAARDAVRDTSDYSGFERLNNEPFLVYVTVSSLPRPNLPALSLVEVFSDYDSNALPLLRDRLLEFNAGGLVLALLVGFGVATGVRRPIRRVGLAAGRFGDGDLDVRAKVRGKDELAELAAAFNAMADRLTVTLRDLQESQSLQQRFVADVSHELRSPLAAMLAAGDRLDSDDHSVRARSADLLLEQTRRLGRLVEDLLEMSRFDAGQASLDLEEVDLGDLSRDAVLTVAPDADILVTTLGDVHAQVDPRRIHTVIRNLVANAVLHGGPPVGVVIDGRSDPIVITVLDGGPGVPADLADTVFDRFVRGDAARGATGTGLGLGLAKENVLLHGGEISLASAVGPTSVSVRLPRSTMNSGAVNPPAGPHR